MPIDRNSLINMVIDDGITEIQLHYTKPHQAVKKKGGIEGFNACRGKDDQELLSLFRNARLKTSLARDSDDPNYWGIVMYERQIEWVLNVLSAAYYHQNLPVLIPPTARGSIKFANIMEFEII